VAEETSTKKPGKSKKKLSTPMMVLYTVGGAAGLYLAYRLYENYKTNQAATTAATTAAQTDPLTGQPYAAGVGSLAPGASGGSTTTASPTDPFQGVDPASTTGATYAQALEDIQTQVDALEPQVLAAITPGSGTSVNVTGSTGSGSGTDTPSTAAARTALIADVQKATGLSSAEAGQQVALYLEGKPLTNKGAVNSIGNQVSAGLAPTTNGVTTLPAPVLARSVTAAAPSESTALTNAEAVAKKDQGTAGEKQAAANVTRTKATLAKQK
jgi:hypothetical protein